MSTNTDTTQAGVEEQSTEQAVEAQVSPRDTAMSDIVAKRREARDREAAEATGQTEESEEAAQEEAGEAEEQSEPMVTIKVDGQERQVPQSQVLEYGVRTLQKESAADKRLAEASTKFREAQAYEQQVRELAASIQAQQKQDGAQPSKKDAEDAKQQARQIIEKLMSGEEDEAAEALANMLAGRGNSATHEQQIDANKLVSQTAQQVREQMEHEKTIASFKTEYSDIAEDPVLWDLADKESLKVHAEHPDWSVEQIVKESGKRIREWVSSKAPEKKPEDTFAGKRERKRTTDTPRAASARVPQEQEKPAPSRSDVVANMRKARGLAQ